MGIQNGGEASFSSTGAGSSKGFGYIDQSSQGNGAGGGGLKSISQGTVQPHAGIAASTDYMHGLQQNAAHRMAQKRGRDSAFKDSLNDHMRKGAQWEDQPTDEAHGEARPTVSNGDVVGGEQHSEGFDSEPFRSAGATSAAGDVAKGAMDIGEVA